MMKTIEPDRSQKILQRTWVRVILALLCCMLWGSAFPCIKTGYKWLHIQTVGSQILFAGYRFFLAGVLAFCVGCLLERRVLTIEKRSVPHVVGLGLFQTTAQYVCCYIGMSYVTGTKGSIINGASAFAAIITAHMLVKGEHLTCRKGTGCLIGFAGVILINLDGIGGGISFAGEGMVILATIIYGTSSTFTKLIAHRGSPMAITAWQLLIGGAVLILIGFACGGRIGNFDGRSLLLLFYMVFLSAAAFSLWTMLLKYNPVAKVTIFGFTIPVFGVILSSIMLGETIFTLINLAALACVCVGVVLVNLPEKPAGVRG